MERVGQLGRIMGGKYGGVFFYFFVLNHDTRQEKANKNLFHVRTAIFSVIFKADTESCFLTLR